MSLIRENSLIPDFRVLLTTCAVFRTIHLGDVRKTARGIVPLAFLGHLIFLKSMKANDSRRFSVIFESNLEQLSSKRDAIAQSSLLWRDLD